MDRFDKIYRLHGLLSNRHTPVSLEKIKEHLECSKSTTTRIIEILRDHLNAPLEYYREPNGYQYNHQSSSTPYELPGLWFSSEELHGLLICQQILQNSAPSKRTISAQKLIYYRDNWYLAAHCHFRNELRIFSIDCVHSAESLD
jgi:predicted DNA-binding transcriptional regulator YafY